jgi:hypothetical protein
MTVWAFAAASLFWTRGILRKGLPADEQTHADWLTIALAAMFAVLFGKSLYGQREHLFFIAMLPFMATRFRRWEGDELCPWCAAGAGLLAGLFACLKPHFLLILIAPDLYWLFVHRRPRPLLAPETIAVVAAGLAYAVHFLLLPEAVRAAFFNELLPLVRKGYGIWNKPWRELVMFGYWTPGAAAAAAPFLLTPRNAGRAWRLARAFGAAGLAAVVVFFVQRKGWPYHALPAWCSFVAVLGLAAAQTRPFAFREDAGAASAFLPTISRRWLQAALAGLFVLANVAGVYYASHLRAPKHLERLLAANGLARFVAQQTKPGDAVLFLSSEVVPAYPMLAQLDRAPGSRFLWLYWFPMAHPAHGRRKVSESAERRLTAQLGVDVQARRPALVLLAKERCWNCRNDESIYSELTRNHFVRRELKDYEELDPVGGMAVFRRKTSEEPPPPE